MEELVVQRILNELRDERRPLLCVLKTIHRLQTFERVLAVEDARPIRAVAFDEQRPTPESSIDRRPADEHRQVEPATGELLNAQRHLLRRRHQQCGQPDRVGVHLERLLHDRVHRHLLAEVVDGVAVVGENCVDERLADVVDVAVNRREHDAAFRVALRALEELLEMFDGLLHHLG